MLFSKVIDTLARFSNIAYENINDYDDETMEEKVMIDDVDFGI